MIANVEKLGLKELIAIGVGGMIGGGIFSVLGLAVEISGHAAPRSRVGVKAAGEQQPISCVVCHGVHFGRAPDAV